MVSVLMMNTVMVVNVEIIDVFVFQDGTVKAVIFQIVHLLDVDIMIIVMVVGAI
jgi:hypothetical protein